ncbi:MAG: polysaccharide biosynthesis C-terminal domain-containing protein [Acutalibacteraceae bacterium]|nr:polysaccharide biosynthesis C-terminal domain-containing protein [Acutalibacteraceae bacterium]
MKSKSEIKAGVILSYALILFNVIYGFISTPFILNYVGEIDYGVYKSVASLSASLAVMDFGLGTTLTRYIAKYNAEKNIKKAESFIGMVFGQFLVLATLVSGIGVVITLSTDKMFDSAFSDQQLLLAQKLVVFLILNLVLRMFENLLIGVASGLEKFIVANGIRFATVFTKFLLILVILPVTKNVLTIVFLETFVASAAIVFLLFYILKRVGMRPKFKNWDLSVFKESFIYTSLMFVQSVTTQFNGNIDNVLLGAQMGAVSVTIYSMSLLVFSMYENLSGSIATIMLPNISKRVVANQTPEQIQCCIEKAGKFQFALLAAALGGFAVLGKDFFNLWLGSGYDNCYYLTLILIVPITFPMIQNVCLSVLRAQNKMVYRTVTLAVSCLINAMVTYFGIKYFGVWGAACGTAMSTVSNLIFMNIYYHKKLKFKIFKMFYHIMGKILPCAIIATGITYVTHSFINYSWVSFLVNVLVFVLVYGFMLLLVGFNKEEKQMIFGRLIIRGAKK